MPTRSPTEPLDSFPCRGPVLDGLAGTTMTQQEQRWLRRFSQTIVVDTQSCPAFQLTEVPPGSITVMRFGQAP
ncbi:MAG: hypothetical protein WC708_06900 [Lentisphaeria bacterium]